MRSARLLVGRILLQRSRHLASHPLEVESAGDALEPRLEGPLAAELRDPLEGGKAGVLGDVVGQGRIGAHAADQGAHGRAVAADQLAEGGALPRGGESGELHVMQACDVGDVSHGPSQMPLDGGKPRTSPCRGSPGP